MANLSQLFSKQKSKYFWAYIVVGALLMIASIMLMPFWAHVAPDLFFANWGGNFIKIVIAGVLFLYLFGYLFKKILAAKITVVKVLTIVEFALLALIAIGCIVSQFAVFWNETGNPLWYRSLNSSTWSNWKRVYDSQNITYGTSALTPGSSSLTSGNIYLQYE